MATMGRKQREELAGQLARLRSTSSSDLNELVQIAGINPRLDFRFGDFTGLDARGANLRGYDFTGAVLTGARFDNALIGPGLDARNRPAGAACFDGAVTAQVSKDGRIFGATVLSSAADYVQYINSWRPRTKSHSDAFEAGDYFRDAPFAPLLVVVPSGTVSIAPFHSAREDLIEGPARPRRRHEDHNVSRIAVGSDLLNVDQWDFYLKDTGRARNEVRDDPMVPVVGVSWKQATSYVSWLSEISGEEYRLLTEVEAEYCLVAGGKPLSETTDNEDILSWLEQSDGTDRLPNRWGVFNTVGGVLQWCSDPWPLTASVKSGVERQRYVCRGAHGVLLQKGQLGFRVGYDARAKHPTVGFRVARTFRG